MPHQLLELPFYASSPLKITYHLHYHIYWQRPLFGQKNVTPLGGAFLVPLRNPFLPKIFFINMLRTFYDTLLGDGVQQFSSACHSCVTLLFMTTKINHFCQRLKCCQGLWTSLVFEVTWMCSFYCWYWGDALIEVMKWHGWKLLVPNWRWSEVQMYYFCKFEFDWNKSLCWRLIYKNYLKTLFIYNSRVLEMMVTSCISKIFVLKV